MRTLVIETATGACSIALVDASGVIDARHVDVGRGHAEHLLPMIAALQGGGRADRILVDVGPGSFTGVRVGVAAARALGFGWSAPVGGYHSLALLAASDSDASGDITVAIEGGHGQLFIGRYATRPLTELSRPRSLPFDQAVEAAIDARVVGNAALRVVSARGWGTAIDRNVEACLVRRLPPALTALVASPFYGRTADARPLSVMEPVR